MSYKIFGALKFARYYENESNNSTQPRHLFKIKSLLKLQLYFHRGPINVLKFSVYNKLDFDNEHLFIHNSMQTTKS